MFNANFNRRSVLTTAALGGAITCITKSLPEGKTFGTAPDSGIAELIANYDIAYAADNAAHEFALDLEAAADIPHPRVLTGRRWGRVDSEGNPAPEAIHAFSHGEIDAQIDALPEFMRADYEPLRNKWHAEMGRELDRYDREIEASGLRAAKQAAAVAEDAMWDARQAVMSYPCQTVDDFRRRDSFIAERRRNGEVFDDELDLIFGSPA